jgi:hypothetical protein
MRLRSPRKSTSEVRGQSCRALPVTLSGGFGPIAVIAPGLRWPEYLLVVARAGSRPALPDRSSAVLKGRSPTLRSLRFSRPDQPSISILPDRRNSKKLIPR